MPRNDGEVGLGGTAAFPSMSERAARRITAALIASGAITSASSRAPLQLTFPAKLAERWMPGLFPGR